MNKYYKFLDTFGTHYVTELRMGAKFGYKSEMTAESLAKLSKEGVDVNFAASASYAGFSAGTSTGTSTSTEQGQKFS
jgi:sporozoite microneme protein 2